MHKNSVEAYGTLDVGRRREIFARAYAEYGAMTDRELCWRLGLPDMNCVRPRVTEMVKAGAVEECGRRQDVFTGKRVRVCRLVPMQMELAI